MPAARDLDPRRSPRSRSASRITLRDAARRKQLGLEPPTTAVVVARIAAQTLLAGLLVAVFGSRGMPVPVLVAGAVALAGVFVTKRTRFGRHIYAIGGNPEAARLSGIDVRKVTIARLRDPRRAHRDRRPAPRRARQRRHARATRATSSSSTPSPRSSSAARRSLGGRGSVIGTVLGTLVFATLANGMNLLRIDSNWQLICTGTILLAAVLIDVLSKGKRS